MEFELENEQNTNCKNETTKEIFSIFESLEELSIDNENVFNSSKSNNKSNNNSYIESEKENATIDWKHVILNIIVFFKLSLSQIFKQLIIKRTKK